jgi:alkylated DNA repair dioxygenase AlkB
MDHIGWHADREHRQERHKIVASLSLGQSRRFIMRDIKDHKNKKEWILSSGDLLLMHRPCQDLLQHSVPIERKVTGARINLTFRIL